MGGIKLISKRSGPRGFREEAVRTATGKSSREWYALLDAFAAPFQDDPGKDHLAAARHLREEYALSPWWAQMVTVRYEWERGLRTEEVALPPELSRAFARQEGARAGFARLTPYRQREAIAWIESAKRPETRRRRVERTVARCLAGES